MKNAEKLLNSMRAGQVYRRQDLKDLSSAVDRDLKALVEKGAVRKIAGGLYCRPKKSASGTPALPANRELVGAFLKTDDFLLTSDDSGPIVYNHKRAGEFRLGEQLFKFRLRYGALRADKGRGAASLVKDRATLPMRLLSREDAGSDLNFWLKKSPEERVDAVEFLREQYYALAGYKSLPRLAHSILIRERRP